MTIEDPSTTRILRKRAASSDIFHELTDTIGEDSAPSSTSTPTGLTIRKHFSSSLLESSLENELFGGEYDGVQPSTAVSDALPRERQKLPTKSRKAVATGPDGVFTSMYRGVTLHKKSRKYEAHFWDASYKRETTTNKSKRSRGKQIYLGSYTSEKDAAHAYDRAALAYLGNDAPINFPVEQYKDYLATIDGKRIEEVIGQIRRGSEGFARGRSKYRGISKHTKDGKWEARLGKNDCGKYEYLGVFPTEEEAAKAYDRAAVKARGFNAVTNFPLSDYKDYLEEYESSQLLCPLPSQFMHLQPAIMMQNISSTAMAQPQPFIMIQPFVVNQTVQNQQQAYPFQWMPTTSSILPQQVSLQQTIINTTDNTNINAAILDNNNSNPLSSPSALLMQHHSDAIMAMNQHTMNMPYDNTNSITGNTITQQQHDSIINSPAVDASNIHNNTELSLPNKLLSNDNEDIMGTLQWLDTIDISQLVPTTTEQQQQ